jgi:Holliday junction resolvasome RuvABC endonuclease subunit
LVIDFIDMAKNELFWRGSGTEVLPGNQNVDDKIKNINDAVAEILSQFPPQMK